MRHTLIVSLSVVLWATGCAHSGAPSLPASHGQLSLAMAYQLDPEGNPREASELPPASLFNPGAKGGVAPERAREAFAEAVALLKGAPTEAQVRQASATLSAACAVDLFDACEFLLTNFQPVKRVEGPSMPDIPREAFLLRKPQVVVLRGRVDTDGRARELQVVESLFPKFGEELVKVFAATRYQPAMLAGHPIATSRLFRIQFQMPLENRTPEAELEWVRMRVARFPGSADAWSHLAKLLGSQTPEAPGYVEALERLNALAPTYWWAANELSWHYVQAGRHAEAEPRVRVARQLAPRNAYVLETSAAVLRGMGRCEEALADQRQAVARLQEQWPREERERFERTLADYQRDCPGGSPPAPSPVAP
ncbi:energy transducer TonB [Myxococcus sp. MISCRS1]|uniref:energy transducer TonB n=1 Tax=Myxococcus TaxID=32 RepID=UPI001CBCFCAA|nr:MULTISPECIES: energy transducer TonB [unclassified Myxococcus]MBZ4409123.1 energy transducer TonB [Myxococcus sp. XM-1-1-1]MCY1003289.1 energy transducer TonB [Myxococcus sp. MISCRS1]